MHLNKSGNAKMEQLNLVGIVCSVSSSSIFSWGDTRDDTKTAYFHIGISLSQRDRKLGYNLEKITVYDSPMLFHAFPDDPLDRLIGSPLGGLREGEILVVTGPLYCADILDFDGWSNYQLTDTPRPFPRGPRQGVFGIPNGYPSEVPSKIPTLKAAKSAKAYLDAAHLLSPSTAQDDYERKILATLAADGLEAVKGLYFGKVRKVHRKTIEYYI